MVTPEEFWTKLDDCRMGRSWTRTSEYIDIKYNTLMIQKAKGIFPSFEIAVKLCYAFDIELAWLMGVEQFCNDQDYRIINHINTYGKTLENVYWAVIDAYRREQRLTWKTISNNLRIPATTLSTFKTDERTLPVDLTVNLLLMLHIPVNTFAELFYSNREIIESTPGIPEEISILRKEIIQLIKRLKDKEILEKIKEYANFIINKNNGY